MPFRCGQHAMRLMTTAILTMFLSSLSGACGANQPAAPESPTTPPTSLPTSLPTGMPAGEGGKLPHVQVDLKKRQVRVDCQMLGIDAPLEFLCVLNGTNEHESVLRS